MEILNCLFKYIFPFTYNDPKRVYAALFTQTDMKVFDSKIFEECCFLFRHIFSTITAWHCLLRNAGSHYYSVSRRCDASWILFLPVHIYSSSTMCGVEYKNSSCTYTLRIFFTAIGKKPIGIIKKKQIKHHINNTKP